MGILYYLVKTFERGILSLYFRKIYVVGAENIPQAGPLIICGNHANQFVDPMMIMSNCNREISFTMAASSFSKPVIGDVAKVLKVIPVHRPEDSKKKGTGKIKFISPVEIEGENTKFTEEVLNLKNGVLGLFVNHKTYIIDKIVDDNKILIKENKEEVFKTDLLNKSVDYFFIPKMDNSTLFTSAYQRLNEDGCICIFPEGTSHDRTEFIKLKAGIAMMSLGAMSEFNTKNVQIVPVGLNYFKREKFRSDVIVEFGKPFEVPAEWATLYKTNKKEATEKLMNEIEYRMKAVTLTAPSYSHLKSLFFVRKLYVPTEVKLTPTQYSELCKRFSKGYEKLKELEDTKQIMAQVKKYMVELDKVGITDYEVKNLSLNYSWMVKRTIWSFILFHLYLILCLPFIIMFTPIAFFIKKKAEKERILAKAKNPNKIEALDVVSSVKITYSIMAIPLAFLLWCIFFFVFTNKYTNDFVELGLFYSLILCILIFPVYLYFYTKMLDRIFFYLKTMLTRFIYFIYPKNILKLKTQRESLVVEVKKYVDEHIGDVDPKYKEDRILFRKEFEENTLDKDILIRRNSQRKTKSNLAEELNIVLNN